MPRDGSGGYSRYTPGTPYVTGTTISSTTVNAEMADIATAIAASIAKDGQTTPTNNLPMGGYRHTGVGNATARDSYAALGQVQDGSSVYAAAGGTADALTLTLSPAPSAYSAGQEFRFKATATNTGAATIDVNSLGAKSIKRDGSNALAAGDITTGQMYSIRYDGTNFQLLNASTFVTQALTDSSTLPATTAFVQTLTSTDSRKGITEQATAAEYVTGTDADRHLTVKVARDNALVRSTAVSATGSVIDFTGIPAWAKRITVMLNAVSTDGTSNPIIQLGTSSGVQTSSYTGSVWQANTSNATNSNGFLLNSATAAANSVTVVATIVNITGNTWLASVVGSYSSNVAIAGGGAKALSGTLDRLRITTVGGSDAFDAGTVNIIYE